MNGFGVAQKLLFMQLESGKNWFDVEDPSTSKKLTSIVEGREDDVDEAVAIARRDMAEGCIFGTEARTYELVQRFEGRRGARVKGSCVVAVFIDPADGTEDDVDQWYRQEHLALIAASPVHIRTTRYRTRSGLVHGAYDDGPTLLALHECTSAEALLDYAIKHGAIVPETPWGKRVFGGAKSVQRSVWDITGRYLHPDIKLDKP